MSNTTFETSQLLETSICNSHSSDNRDGRKQLRNENPFRIIIDHIKINSVRNKFESLVDFVSANLGDLMISETITDKMSSQLQFIIEEFSKPFHLDRTINCGGILFYFREDIPTKGIKGITVSYSFEVLLIKLNLAS